MSVASQIRKWASRADDEPSDVIARLLLAADEDNALRSQIISLIHVPTIHRQSLVNTALHEMKLRGESKGACAAFALLATDEGAKIALSILKTG